MPSLGKRSMMLRVIGVRSRITQTISNGCRGSMKGSGSATWSLKTVTVAPIQHRPVRERKSDVLVVVEDGYSKALLFGRHRLPPERCDPLATRPIERLRGGMPCRDVKLCCTGGGG